jgi:hypothetical protein
MQSFIGGGSCGTTTGFFCAATAILLFAGPLAPLVGATAPGCAIGLVICKSNS